ncbi:MAG TPA: Pr6Pr family membrane protein [Gaiellales bacterium]
MPAITLVRIYRAAFGLLGLSSLVIELATLHERHRLHLGNFLSYFTVEANLFAGFVLLLSGFALTAAGEPAWLAFLRGAATLYLAITGLVFSLLLAGLEGVEFTAVPWDNLVLHYVMPAVIVGDWLIAPTRRRIAFRSGLSWLAFPLAYVVYSLIRGHSTHWYPYPFLDPGPRGYTGVIQSSIGIALTAAVLVWIVTLLTGSGSLLARARSLAA